MQILKGNILIVHKPLGKLVIVGSLMIKYFGLFCQLCGRLEVPPGGSPNVCARPDSFHLFLLSSSLSWP